MRRSGPKSGQGRRAARDGAEEDARMETADAVRCDCGHDAVRTGCGTGYGSDAAGRTFCYACCASRDRESIARGDRQFLYLSGDGRSVTNWPGTALMSVARETDRTMYGFCVSKRTFVRAVDENGRTWHGSGGGRGMYLRLRRSVAAPAVRP